jgi:hypothetical protein
MPWSHSISRERGLFAWPLGAGDGRRSFFGSSGVASRKGPIFPVAAERLAVIDDDARTPGPVSGRSWPMTAEREEHREDPCEKTLVSIA